MGPIERARQRAEELAGELAPGELAAAAARLSGAYRSGRPPARLSPSEALAYAVTRLPATAAASRAALKEAGARLPARPATQLDLGSGCGAALLAASSLWPEMRSRGFVERDGAMAELGGELCGGSLVALGSELAEWAAAPQAGHDLVTASYCLGELGREQSEEVLLAAYRAARLALVVVEPGTPAGFARVRRWRARLLEEGAALLAPCPHQAPCPVEGGDWCHFSARLGRSRLHRRLKGAAAGFEDEPFSYLAVTHREVTAEPPGGRRVVRHPLVRPGRVELVVCAEGSLEREVVRRKEAAWPAASRARWGDWLE